NVEYLLQHGANGESRNRQDFRPSDLAMQSNVGTTHQREAVARQLFQLTPKREEKGYTTIGNHYALINKITREEAEELRQQTGIEVSFPEGKNKVRFTLGKGQYGKLRIARKVELGSEGQILKKN